MIRKLGFSLLWMGLCVYAFLLAPPSQPGTFELIKNLCIGNWTGINPLIISLFYLMGIWPMIYACVLFAERHQPISVWPFVLVSFGVGAFALLPYLALRQPNPEFAGDKNFLLKQLDSRWTGVALTLATGVLLAGGLLYGDWSEYIQQWHTSRFIHVMSIDFCLLCLLFPALLGDDLARRGLKGQIFWAVALVPLLGPLAYLCFRPPLPDAAETAQREAVST